MPGKCILNPLWTTKDAYAGWIGACEYRHKAKCKLCYKEIDASNMGKAALKKHIQGTKHLSLIKGPTQAASQIRDFCVSKIPVPRSNVDETTSAVASSMATPSTDSLNPYVTRKDVLDAEILWCLKCATIPINPAVV
ncbi:hypothetical protein AVEN_56207-1 [Araneus ventricosus]|uniref:Uncharacterized protein n=1 Tax=Araneus ventricosus TaxID=182803 RepID=A0A4Y2P135_ARAVE|nr:hypothetical protein AVEN_56207-1 [Araneus ventricosus]